LGYNYFIRRYQLNHNETLALSDPDPSFPLFKRIHNNPWFSCNSHVIKTGTPAIFVHSHSYPFTSTGGETICKLLFSFNPSLPIYSAVMYASTSNTNSLSSDYTSYFHQNPLNFFAIDLENANKGQTQTVQITGLAPNTPITIYIQVMVDSTMGFSYNIVAT
jgi:hypothetical protein